MLWHIHNCVKAKKVLKIGIYIFFFLNWLGVSLAGAVIATIENVRVCRKAKMLANYLKYEKLQWWTLEPIKDL